MLVFFFISKADLKRNISLLQAAVQKKDGTLLFQSPWMFFICNLCRFVLHSPLKKKSVPSLISQSLVGPFSRDSIISEMAI